MFSMWARLAISGTTPRYRACRSAWLATTFDRTTFPSITTAAAVSSQVDSIPRICAMSPGGDLPLGMTIGTGVFARLGLPHSPTVRALVGADGVLLAANGALHPFAVMMDLEIAVLLNRHREAGLAGRAGLVQAQEIQAVREIGGVGRPVEHHKQHHQQRRQGDPPDAQGLRVDHGQLGRLSLFHFRRIVGFWALTLIRSF